jgi:hypothetical protein
LSQLASLSLQGFDALPLLAFVGPARTLWSRSAWRTQPRSVSAVHPIFDAIELIAAHSEACSPRCSNIIRTARARTSGEYLACRSSLHPLKVWSARQTRRGAEEPGCIYQGSHAWGGLPGDVRGKSRLG